MPSPRPSTFCRGNDSVPVLIRSRPVSAPMRGDEAKIDFDIPHRAVLLRPVGEKVSLPVLKRGARQAMPRARRDPSDHAALAQQPRDQATDGFGRVTLLQQGEAAARPVLRLMQVGGDLPERRNGGLVPR